MNKERLFELMNQIDDDLILRAEKASVQTGRGRSVWLRVGVLVACIGLLCGMLAAIPLFVGDDPIASFPGGTRPPMYTTVGNKPPVSTTVGTRPPVGTTEGNDLPKIPVWENALYSADTIANVFYAPTYDPAATNSYQRVCVLKDDYLYIDGLPKVEYLDIYQYHSAKVSLDEEDFASFVESIFPKLSDSLGMELPSYKIQPSISSSGWEVSPMRMEDFYLSASQTAAHSSVYLSRLSSRDRDINLNGELVQVDQRLTDAEIIASLDSVKTKLFEIFGTSFEDVKVLRHYSADFQYGASYIWVYYYNEDAHPLNTRDGKPVSDHILLEFSNYPDYSESILNNASIMYTQKRVDASETYRVTESAKTISLADAETLLYNGYVFGGHSCPRCMEMQAEVSFEDYDYVDLEYVFATNLERFNLGIPFYAFYKKIVTLNNGLTVYAKTYVPAIEVSGYEEYFQSQIKDHDGQEDEILPW